MPRALKVALITALYASVVTVVGIGLADWLAQLAVSQGSDGSARVDVIRRGGPWLFGLPIAGYTVVAVLVSRRGLPLTVSRYAAAVLLGALLTPVLFLVGTLGAIRLYRSWAMPQALWAVLLYGTMALPGAAAALLLRVRQRTPPPDPA